LLAGLALPAQAQDDAGGDAQNVVQVLQSRDDMSALVGAVGEAGLVGALQSGGPFTVFAPTNDAFSALGTPVDSLTTEQLRSVLRNHVLTQPVPSAQAIEIGRALTMHGDTLSITQNNGDVMVGSATVVEADVEASNGVIHVIDAVLLPAAMRNEGGM
jgi:uncharacterized surface protein with fasciclin (FAS1) repeats